jgi:hypothetical protein
LDRIHLASQIGRKNPSDIILDATDHLLFFATIRTDSVAPIKVAGCPKRDRDLIGLLIADAQRPGKTGIADPIRSTPRYVLVHSTRQVHGDDVPVVDDASDRTSITAVNGTSAMGGKRAFALASSAITKH